MTSKMTGLGGPFTIICYNWFIPKWNGRISGICYWLMLTNLLILSFSLSLFHSLNLFKYPLIIISILIPVYIILHPSTSSYIILQYTTTYYNILQHTTTFYNLLQHTTTYYNILQHITTYYNLLQHTTTYYNILQHTTTYYILLYPSASFSITATYF